MAKSNLNEMHQIADPWLSFEFELVIPYIPGETLRAGPIVGAPNNADVEDTLARQYGTKNSSTGYMRILAQAVTIPGKSIEQVLVQLTGGELSFAGLNKPEHELSVTFVDRRDMTIYKALNRWFEYCRSHKTQHGHYKSEYSVTSTVRIFDQRSLTVDQFKVYGMWPSQVPQVSLEATGSTAVQHQVTFQCDFCELEMQEESYDFVRNVYGEHANA